MRTLASLESPISSLVVSPDGSTVVTASNEGIGFLDLLSGQRSVTALEEEVSRLTFGPDGLLAGTLSGEVWSIGRAPARLFEAIDDEISGIAATSDGTIAVCGGEPFAVATFGPHGNEEWRGEPYKWPYCVRFSPDGNLLAVATWDGNLFVFDAHDLPDELTSLDGEYAGGPIFDARFLPGERVLVVGASFVRIWDRGTCSYAASRDLPTEAFACAVSPDGGCAVVSTNDQRLRLFALPDLTELGDLAAGPKGNKELSYFPDYAEFCHVKGPATIRTLAFHPDGTRVFGSTEDHRILEFTRTELQRAVSSSARLREAMPAPPTAQLSLALPVPAPPAPTRASAKPAARASAKPAARTSAKVAAARASAKPVARASTKPVATHVSAKPAARASAKVAARVFAKPAARASAKVAASPTDRKPSRRMARGTDSAPTRPIARHGVASPKTAAKAIAGSNRSKSTGRATNGAPARAAKISARNAVAGNLSKKSPVLPRSKPTAVGKGSKLSTKTAARPRSR
ncbi:MAG: WD40 repeat domain-containing protein [bacterium]